jgi:hypothetical protein
MEFWNSLAHKILWTCFAPKMSNALATDHDFADPLPPKMHLYLDGWNRHWSLTGNSAFLIA